MRPLSISIISWSYISYSVVTLVPKIVILVYPEVYEEVENLLSVLEKNELVSVPLWFQVLFSYLASLVLMIAGILMLKGYAWGRSLIVLWTLSALLLIFFVSGITFYFYVKIPFAVIIIFLLFRPKANEYFKAGGAATDPIDCLNE